MTGFWNRQFKLPATRAQRWFDVSFGMAVPLVCLYFDPTVFRSGGAGDTGWLVPFRILGYAEIALSIVALGYFLLTQRASSVLTGFLLGSAIFAVLLGIAMLPLTMLGLVMLIGILGFAPFVTGFVYARNAWRCWQQSSAQNSRLPSRLAAALGVILALGIPASLHATASHLVNGALVKLQNGPDQEFEPALHTLRWTAYDSDRLAFAYQTTKDEKQRARLARAFNELTGQSIETRLAELSD
jgi:hypothetical protein